MSSIRVGFVDDHHLDAGEQQLAALDVIEQAPGRGDQHVDATVDLHVLVAKETPPSAGPGELLALE